MAGFKAKNAERCGAQHEMLTVEGRHADPSSGQDAPELAVREERDVAAQSEKTCDEPIGAIGHLRGRLATWTTVSKHIPIWSFLANVRRAPPFVLAIVPFGQVRLDVRTPIPVRLVHTFVARVAAGWSVPV